MKLMKFNVQVINVSSSLGSEEQISIATNVTEQLIELLTEAQSKPLLPNDLGASARILTIVVNVLENNNATNEVLLPSSSSHRNFTESDNYVLFT